MNYVFISPVYPITCTLFCDRLNRMGANVLGIGDTPYHDLSELLKNALREYYYVSSLEDYDQVYRAVAYYIHKYGRIDWLESMNEYWLRTDAKLRTDFNIAVGTREDQIGTIVRKSEMKKGLWKRVSRQPASISFPTWIPPEILSLKSDIL